MVALAAEGGRPGLLAEQACRLGAGTVAVAREEASRRVAVARCERAGAAAVRRLVGAGRRHARWPACGADVVLNGITGSIGLAPTLAALDAGSTLALANKESLIVGGPLVTRGRGTGPDRARSTPSTRRSPSACARAPRGEVERLVLTASGGPFRGRSRDGAGAT